MSVFVEGKTVQLPMTKNAYNLKYLVSCIYNYINKQLCMKLLMVIRVRNLTVLCKTTYD